MKKVCLSLIVVVCALLGMTSCTSKNYCYEVKAEYEYWSSSDEAWKSDSTTEYHYCTPRCINARISEAKKEMKQMNLRKIKITKKKLNKSEADCEAMGEDDNYWNF